MAPAAAPGFAQRCARIGRRLAGRRPRRRLAILAGVLLALCFVGASAVWLRVDKFALFPTGSADGGTTYLLLGSDSREFVTTEEDRTRYGGPDATPGERADVIIAARVEENGATRLLLISRDLLVSHGGRLVRLSETFLDGPQALVEGMCESLGLGIDHVVVLELDGLRDTVDAIGGLDMVMDTEVRDRGSGLQLAKGRVHLSGDNVLAYVGSRNFERRSASGVWRKSDSEGPDRPGRAAEVLRLVGNDADLSLWSPVQSARVLWAASGGIRMDQGMSVGDAMRMRGLAGGLSEASDLRLPVTTSGGRFPVDQLDVGAGATIAAFEGTGDPPDQCDDPKLPLARRD